MFLSERRRLQNPKIENRTADALLNGFVLKNVRNDCIDSYILCVYVFQEKGNELLLWNLK